MPPSMAPTLALLHVNQLEFAKRDTKNQLNGKKELTHQALKELRSISCGQWMDQTHHTRPLRSTSVNDTKNLRQDFEEV